MTITLELNKEKLNGIANALNVVGESFNIEIYNKKATLKLVETLNLSSGDSGIMDDQLTQLRSDIKFLQAQQDVIQAVIKLAL
jgi:hypothetical protein